MALGAGRGTLDDAVDPAVGITVVAPPGAAVAAGDPVLILHHRGGRGLDEALPLLDEAIGIGDGPFDAPAARGRGNPRLTNGAENR